MRKSGFVKVVFFTLVFVFLGQNAALSNPEATERVQKVRPSAKPPSKKVRKVGQPVFHLDDKAHKSDPTEGYSLKIIYNAPPKNVEVRGHNFLGDPRVLQPNPLLDSNRFNPYVRR